MKKETICFKMGAMSFLIGFAFIFLNYYWVMYGIVYFVLGILGMCLHEKKNYIKVASMIYFTLSLFAMVGIFERIHMIFPFATCIIYGIIFYMHGFKNETK